MRIGMLVRRFDPAGGGTERDFASSARCLSRVGHEVRIYAARAHAESWQDMTVRRLPVPVFPRSLQVLGFGLLADRFARRDGAELTISFGRTVDSDLIRCEGGAHAAYLEAARQWESRATLAARSLSPYHAAQCRMEASGFRSSRLKMVIAISRLVGDDLERRFAIPHSKIKVLYNGVDCERFQNAANPTVREEVRGRFGIGPSDRMVLFIGHGFGRKGLGKLIEAWPMADANAYLIVAGEDHGSAFYRRMAQRLGIEGRVIFLGKRNDISNLLAAADVAALPSLFEAFGNVVLEGMAAGLPVLTSARCGAAEVLPAQMKPFVVQNPMDPADIARCLNALLAAPRELGAIMRAAAQQYTWEHFGDRMAALIAQIAGSRRDST